MNHHVLILAAGLLSWWAGDETAVPQIVSVLGFGFLLGLKHATDADHIVAISTIVSEKQDARAASTVGMMWGLGHTLALLVVGLGVILLKTQIPEHVASLLEFAVGVMLVFLGVRLFLRLRRARTIHFHEHEHDGYRHAHLHIHEEGVDDPPHTHHGFSFDHRSLLIGLVHGMAGSAALMLLVLTTISSTWLAVAYILVFGLGSIGGMMAMSFVLALPVALMGARFDRLQRSVQFFAASLSVIFGLIIMWEIGHGLFL